MIFDHSAYSDGTTARIDGAGPEDCPYDIGTDAGKSWLKGYWDASSDPTLVSQE